MVDGLYNDVFSSELKTYVVVYGSKVYETGEPSERLQARLDAWYKVFQDGWKKIIVSGWIWKEGLDESGIMKEYLIEKWIIKENIIVDRYGYTTRKTSENAREIIEKLEKDTSSVQVIWVSQWFHISRVRLSLRQEDFSMAYWIAPKYFELRDVYAVMRELPAYVKYFFSM